MKHPVLGGVAAASVFFSLTEVIPGGGVLLVTTVVLISVIGVAYGPRLDKAVRVSSTVLFVYFAALMFLIGRTMGAGLNTYTSGMSLKLFALFGIWPGFSLLRIWGPRNGAKLLTFLVPVCFICAAVVAGTEEHLFVLRYKATGTGPKPRWTVSNHWLAYDKATQSLQGSD
jgi:hypothetical protein